MFIIIIYQIRWTQNGVKMKLFMDGRPEQLDWSVVSA